VYEQLSYPTSFITQWSPVPPNSAFNLTDQYERAGLLAENRINGGSSCKSCTQSRSQREFQDISESSFQMVMVQAASFHRPFAKIPRQ